MFNLFKKKLKQSEWMKGLLAAQSSIEQCGYETTMWAVRDMEKEGIDYYLGGEWYNGYLQYLKYYENNLK